MLNHAPSHCFLQKPPGSSAMPMPAFPRDSGAAPMSAVSYYHAQDQHHVQSSSLPAPSTEQSDALPQQSLRLPMVNIVAEEACDLMWCLLVVLLCVGKLECLQCEIAHQRSYVKQWTERFPSINHSHPSSRSLECVRLCEWKPWYIHIDIDNEVECQEGYDIGVFHRWSCCSHPSAQAAGPSCAEQPNARLNDEAERCCILVMSACPFGCVVFIVGSHLSCATPEFNSLWVPRSVIRLEFVGHGHGLWFCNA